MVSGERSMVNAFTDNSQLTTHNSQKLMFSMASINLIEAFQEFKDAENIDRPTMMKVVEDVFKTLLRKKYGSDENFDVIVNAEKGDLEIIRRRMIVEDGACKGSTGRN